MIEKPPSASGYTSAQTERAGGGPAPLARSVRKEEREAAAFAHAVDTLKGNFASPAHDGPIRCGRFLADVSDANVQAFAAVQEFLQALHP